MAKSSPPGTPAKTARPELEQTAPQATQPLPPLKGGSEGPGLLEQLAVLVEDPQAELSAEVIGSLLARHGEKPENKLTNLVMALHHPDPKIRGATARAIQSLTSNGPNPASTELLTCLIGALRTETEGRIILVLISTIQQLGVEPPRALLREIMARAVKKAPATTE